MTGFLISSKIPSSSPTFSSNPPNNFSEIPFSPTLYLNLISFPITSNSRRFPCCYLAAKHQQQSDPVKKRSSSASTANPNTKKKKKKPKSDSLEVEVVEDEDRGSHYRDAALPLPKPPAGFALDEQGRVVLASNKRLVTIVDSTNNFPLECVIRRVFRSGRGKECMLLCPVDTPVQILKSTNVEGWSAVSDEEIENIIPSAAYALAKIHMHLVYSGFCYTARGGFCYTEDDIFEVRTDDDQDVDGLPTEGIEITCFHLDGSQYMIYTPSDPLLFVVVKNEDGVLQIADDELLEDPAVISAIDEETEFNAFVEEEAVLMESLLGSEV